MMRYSIHYISGRGRSLSCLLILLLLCSSIRADRYSDYIDQYAHLAVEQEKKYGIPASITLAQGLLESGAGTSSLARRGNNHFGIKCHKGWEGDTLLRSDDAPDECFRAYPKVEDSYEDHSRFLLRPRYQPLFALDRHDYTAWAKTLRQCGYATDPNYAARLVSIIERYSLYNYGLDDNERAEQNALFIQSTLLASHKVRRSFGLYYVIANPGDTYGSIAKELNMDKRKLMEYNDALLDMEIRPWEEVYLQEKRDKAADDDPGRVVIGEEESIHAISQRFAIKMSSLHALNPKAKDQPGTRLKLK